QAVVNFISRSVNRFDKVPDIFIHNSVEPFFKLNNTVVLGILRKVSADAVEVILVYTLIQGILNHRPLDQIASREMSEVVIGTARQVCYFMWCDDKVGTRQRQF